ncbi:NifU family protein [Rhodobacter capsulatus]|nr:NifU family protein [Rhodobacter capsulatus]
MTRIRALIDEMRPTFRRDGGDIELVRVEGAKVIVHLSGACAGCMLAGQTLYGVQKRITDVLGRPFRVIPDIRH